MAARKPEAQEPEAQKPGPEELQTPVTEPEAKPEPEGDVEAAHQGVEHDPADAAVDLTAGEKGAEPAFIAAEDAE